MSVTPSAQEYSMIFTYAFYLERPDKVVNNEKTRAVERKEVFLGEKSLALNSWGERKKDVGCEHVAGARNNTSGENCWWRRSKWVIIADSAGWPMPTRS
jgi:hypothetical protein